MFSEGKTGSFRTAVIVCGTATILLGLLGAAGWITGFRLLSGVGSNYLPMAPDTAFLFVILGTVLLIASPRNSARFSSFQSFAVILISIYGFLKFVEYFADVDLTFSKSIFPQMENLGQFPVGRMSPITGGLFCIAGVAMLLRFFRKENSRAGDFESGLIVLVILTGFVAFTGYVYGAPLLYSGKIIPLALTTALAFLFLGCGLAAAAGTEGFLLRHVVGPTVKARILRAFLPLLGAAIWGHGLLNEIFSESLRFQYPLVSALLALILVGVMGVLVTAVARSIAKAMDLAEADRKRTEEALRLSERRYRRLFESAKDGILILEATTGEIVDVNPFLQKTLGYERHELLGKKLWEIGPPEFVARSTEAFRDLQEKDYLRYEDLPLQTHDGRSISVEFISNVYLVGERKVIQCNIRDITERKLADLALRKAEENYRNIFENASEGIFQSTCDGRFLIANPAMSRILGYGSPEDLISNLTDIHQFYVEPTRRAELIAILEEFGSTKELESEVYRRDGTKIWISESVRLVRDAAGNPSHYEGVLEDITQRKRAEQALRESEQRLLQAQKMEAIGQLAGGVAHDFNNTLMAISGYSELLLLQLSDSDPHRSVASEIQKAVTHGANLTRQLLAFSRKQILSPQVLNLSLSIVGMQDMLRRLIGEDVDLKLVIRDEQAFIRADQGQIEQVLMNLAVNAHDAMPQGGKLTIETDKAELDETYCASHIDVSPGWYVMLSISDTGHGMDESTLSRIFEPFFTTKGEGKGTGLGLSTVYGIVKQSGGHIWVYSQQEQGTVFKLYFPRVDEQAIPATSIVSTEDLPGHGTVILLVDDNDAVRAAVAAILRAKGYVVLEAGEGNAALEILHNDDSNIKLLISDIVMPGMSGYELAGWIQSRRPKIKVLLMSGYTDEAIKRSANFDPNTAFLQKPCSMTALMKKIQELLRQE